MANYGSRYRFSQPRASMFPPGIAWLMALNVFVFVLGFIPVDGIPLQQYFVAYGALWPLGSELWAPWQYVTYMFLHGGMGHIFFNLFALWMFGMEIEQLWGTKRFLAFYAICGLGAAIIHSIVTMLMADGAPTIGASGAVMGVLTAFGMVFPDRIVFLGFFFPMRAKFAVLLFIAMDLFMGYQNAIGASDDRVAHFAHLGGVAVGALLIVVGGKLTLGRIFDRIPGFGGQRRAPYVVDVEQQNRPPRRGNVIDASFRDVPREEPRRPAPPKMDFGPDQGRIDAILDKISRQGYQSLTDEERAILLEASRRM